MHNIATVVYRKNNLCDNKLFYVLISPYLNVDCSLNHSF